MADVDGRHAREVEQGRHRRRVMLAVDQVRRLADGAEVVHHGDGGLAQRRRHLAQPRAERHGRMPARQEACRQLEEIELGARPLVERAVGQEDAQAIRSPRAARRPSPSASEAMWSRKRITSR